MKVAAYQAPLFPIGSMRALDLIEEQVRICESQNIQILCCPEAILGGLADYADGPVEFARTIEELELALARLASDSVTTIIGFTESSEFGLYNSAAVFSRGRVLGVYRKVHPAINRSVYLGGTGPRVFEVDGLTFGIVICYDSTFPELAQQLALDGARAVFIPTNNGLPPGKGGEKLSVAARESDQRTAINNRLWIIRADVTGQCGHLSAHGSTAITAPNGEMIAIAEPLASGIVTAEI